jgi:hypothetical protein
LRIRPKRTKMGVKRKKRREEVEGKKGKRWMKIADM